MSANTGIEWTDATWNPVTGCAKVSAGCKHCYAERDWARLAANPKTRYHGRAFTDVLCHDDVLGLPLRWTKPRRVFVNSMSDLFHDDVPDDFIDRVFAVMARAPQHSFQVLTKRAQRMLDYLSKSEGMIRDEIKYEPAAETACWPLHNVWLGVSVEDQATADARVPLLLNTPAAVRWISAEPLLGPVDLSNYLEFYVGPGEAFGLDWIVVGGESGAKARPMHPEWVRSLRDQCAATEVPFLFKQWGEWAPANRIPMLVSIHEPSCILNLDGSLYHGPSQSCSKTAVAMLHVGKKAAGRLLDGVLHDTYPSIRTRT